MAAKGKNSKNEKRKLLGEKLNFSLSGETDSLENRFKKAEKLFSANDSSNRASKQIQAEDTEPVLKQSFSMLESEITAIEQLVLKAASKGVIINKSEIIRAAIANMFALNDKEFEESIRKVVKLKRGRK